jgi:uncharacterized membrane protein HdeD (DUF308 family)
MSESPSSTDRQQAAEAIGFLWWLPLIRGILLLVLGGYSLFQPGMTIAVLAQVIGIFVIANGTLYILAGVMGAVPSRLSIIVRGAIEILVGLFVFANPILVAGITGTFLIYMLAFTAILSGIFEIMAAIQDRKQIEGGGWLILSGALSVMFGVLVLISPIAFGLVMVRILGFFAILAGIALIAFAFRLKDLGKQLAG